VNIVFPDLVEVVNIDEIQNSYYQSVEIHYADGSIFIPETRVGGGYWWTAIDQWESSN
jgi:hypothetical protein